MVVKSLNSVRTVVARRYICNETVAASNLDAGAGISRHVNVEYFVSYLTTRHVRIVRRKVYAGPEVRNCSVRNNDESDLVAAVGNPAVSSVAGQRMLVQVDSYVIRRHRN